MSKHSLREVKTTFEDILSENGRVLQELDKTISATQSDIDTVNDLYTRALDKFVTAQIRPINSEMLKTLSDLAGNGRDFEGEYKNGLAQSHAAEIRLSSLQTTHGDETSLYGKLKKLNDDKEIHSRDIASLGRENSQLKEDLQPVKNFNAYAASKNKPLLDAEGLSYFSSKKDIAHAWSWLTDKHYRQGYGIAKAFAAAGDDIPALQNKVADNAASEQQLRDNLAKLAAQASTVEAQLKEIRGTAAQVISENALREKMKKDVIAAFDDEKFLNKTVKKLGAKFPVFVVEQRAKLDNLRKLQGAAQKSRQAVQQASGKLDKHMPKLRRGASSSGSTRITIDLNGIKTSYAGMQQGVRTQATQLRQTSASVRDYQYSSSSASPVQSGGMDPVIFMAAIMMSDIHHQTPSVDVPSVGDSFNTSAIDGNIGNVDVSVPDISVSVPDISVPDISVPDISFDSGSFGGGFDGGGGFSGGFD